MLGISPLQEVQRRSPPKKSKKKKRKTISFDNVVVEVRASDFAGLTDDPDARIRVTFDIEMRFKMMRR